MDSKEKQFRLENLRRVSMWFDDYDKEICVFGSSCGNLCCDETLRFTEDEEVEFANTLNRAVKHHKERYEFFLAAQIMYQRGGFGALRRYLYAYYDNSHQEDQNG